VDRTHAAPETNLVQEERIRVLIADDDASFVEALRVMLETDGRFTVVGAAANGEEAVRQVGELEPAVVAMDIVMPVMDGLEATRLIRDRSPGCQVVLVSGSIFQTRGEEKRRRKRSGPHATCSSPEQC